MVIYNSMIEAASLLPEAERAQLYAAAVSYATTGIEPRLSSDVQRAIFLSHREALRQQFAKASKSGGLPDLGRGQDGR